MKRVLISIAALTAVHATVIPTAANIVVVLGSDTVDLAPGTGTTTATIDITFLNDSTTDPAPIAGYSLFVDIGPLGLELPAGVSFADPAATYIAGEGTEPLTGASKSSPPSTINLAPAAGDIGLGQAQLFDGSIDVGESFPILTLNLLVDRALASPGMFDITLNALGENSIDALAGAQPFSVTNGVLTLSPIPEAGAWLLMFAAASATAAVTRLGGRRRTATTANGTPHRTPTSSLVR